MEMSEEKLREMVERARRLEAEKARLFNPDELIQEARKIRSVEDEVLGTVKFRVLTMREMLELNKVKDEEERALRMVHMMLMDAYPNLTVEKLRELPAPIAVRLMNLLLERAGFQTSSSTGSGPTP